MSGRCEQFTNEFIDGIKTVGNFIGINDHVIVPFDFVLILFPPCNSLGKYRWNIFVDKIQCNLPTETFR
jgi:hypothetical protein